MRDEAAPTRVRIFDSRADAAQQVVDELASLAVSGELKVLGVATGSSPSAVYAAMAARAQPEFTRMTLFALDEYVGLPTDHPESYRAVVAREVARPLGIPDGRVNLPNADHPEAYDVAIRAAGGVDVQLLGIGRNGHIGFNEPGSPFESRTRVVALEESTRVANARFFDSSDEVPREAVTQGIATILGAKRLILMAFGFDKREAVEAALLGPITDAVPASALRGHPNVTWVLDKQAAGALATGKGQPEIGAALESI